MEDEVLTAAVPVGAKRLSPFHHKQASVGAQFIVDTYGWARVEQYADPPSETYAIDRGVGLVDLSHLAKLALNGPGLKQLTTGRYVLASSDLKGVVLGRGRGLYDGTWCAIFSPEEGMLFGDEVLKEKIVKELAEGRTGHFTVVDVSSVFAGCCFLGPNSRALLRRLTELNVNPEEFPTLSVTHTPIRHVPAILLRNDLGQTLAYQLYFERAYAEYIWDAVFDSGKSLGVAPVGRLAVKAFGLG